MGSVTFLCDSKVLSQIDRLASERELSRSRLINKILNDYFAPQQPLDNEVKLLEVQIEHKQEIITLKDAEIADLKELNGRLWLTNKELNDRLVQYQLPPPEPVKRGFWSRLFRREPKE